jgi:hypothetical protein
MAGGRFTIEFLVAKIAKEEESALKTSRWITEADESTEKSG